MSCPVCFGGDDLAIRESLNAGIGVLLGVTAIVLSVLARFIVRLARRSREHAHLVDAEAWHQPAADPHGGSVRMQPDQGQA